MQIYSIDIKGERVFYASNCGGTLIRGDVVMSAAHCFKTRFSFNSNYSDVPFQPNVYHPTLESTLFVFAGVHDHTTLSYLTEMQPYPSVRLTVEQIIKVN